jgi:hypothetical protein
MPLERAPVYFVFFFFYTDERRQGEKQRADRSRDTGGRHRDAGSKRKKQKDKLWAS